MTESNPTEPSPLAVHDLLATAQERRASGKGARKQVSRGSLGYWAEENRGHDALKTIVAQNQIRVPELVPIRHHRMAVSPWNFYRGAAAVMAGDLASQPDGTRPPPDHRGAPHPRRSQRRRTGLPRRPPPGRNRLTLQEDRRSLFDKFTVADVVRQVVGVGSVGMQVYLVLLEGRTGDDPLFLQAKQAGPSVYEAHVQPSRHPGHGERVITGKRLIQSATDIFAGWGSLHGKDYYVRQFRDMKIIPKTDLIAPHLAEFATACGATLARAHVRTGDPMAIDAYIGNGSKFAAAIGRFARLYADQNERDHARLVSAIAAGEVESLPG